MIFLAKQKFIMLITVKIKWKNDNNKIKIILHENDYLFMFIIFLSKNIWKIRKKNWLEVNIFYIFLVFSIGIYFLTFHFSIISSAKENSENIRKFWKRGHEPCLSLKQIEDYIKRKIWKEKWKIFSK